DVAERPWPKMGADRFECSYPASLKWYAFVQFVAINAMALGYLAAVKRAELWQPLLLALLILAGCVGLGLLFEGRRALWKVEAARQLLMAGAALAWALWLAPQQLALGLGLAALCLGSLAWLAWLAARPQLPQAARM